MLFSLLTLWSANELYTKRKIRFVFSTAAFASLLVLGHPENTFHTFFIVCLIWLFVGLDKHTALLSFVSAIFILLFTSPWWLTILVWHGFSPFASSLQSGWHHWFFWTPLLKMDFAGERFVDLITVFGIIGFAIQIARKQYFLPIWLILPFIIEPRNPTLFASLSLCMLAAIGFQEVARTVINSARGSSNHLGDLEIISTRSGKFLLSIFILYPLISAFSVSLQLSSYHLTEEQRHAIEWIRENTPPESRFVILAFEGTFTIPLQEWLPSLSKRINAAIEVGYEWMPNRAFEKRRGALFNLNRCIFETIDCVESWSTQQGVHLDYVIVYQGLLTPVDFKLGNEPIRSMINSPNYRLVYESDLIKIFQRIQP